MIRRQMRCACCGRDAGRWQQHWNRDTGYGVCAPCVTWMRSRGVSEAEIADDYGQEGVNWGAQLPEPAPASASEKPTAVPIADAGCVPADGA